MRTEPYRAHLFSLVERALDADQQRRAFAIFRAFETYLKKKGELVTSRSSVDGKPAFMIRGKDLERLTGREDLGPFLDGLTFEVPASLQSRGSYAAEVGSRTVIVINPKRFRLPTRDIRSKLDMTMTELRDGLLAGLDADKDTLLHELIHALDRTRIGQTAWDAASSSYVGPDEDAERYFSHPIELNAFFQSRAAVVRAEFDDIFADDDPDWAVMELEDWITTPVQDQVKAFIKGLPTDIRNGLNPSNIREFQKRAADLYSSLRDEAIEYLRNQAELGHEEAAELLDNNNIKWRKRQRAMENVQLEHILGLLST